MKSTSSTSTHVVPPSGKSELRAADDGLRVERRLAAAHEHVVAVEGDVDRAELELDAASLGHELLQPPGERDAARVDSDEREPLEVVVPLDQLVRQPRHRARERVRVEDLARAFARRRSGLHRCSFPASLDRLKGTSASLAAGLTGMRAVLHTFLTRNRKDPAA